MKTLNDLRISETPPKQFKNKFIDEGYTYTLNNIKKTLLLDNLPKLAVIFCGGLAIIQLLYTMILMALNYQCEAQCLITTILVYLFLGVSVYYFYTNKK